MGVGEHLEVLCRRVELVSVHITPPPYTTLPHSHTPPPFYILVWEGGGVHEMGWRVLDGVFGALWCRSRLEGV